jgi:hypothetical protein
MLLPPCALIETAGVRGNVPAEFRDQGAPDDESRGRYQKCGSTFFTAPGSKKPLRNYYEVPPAIIEQEKELVAWALTAIQTRK